MVAHSLARDKTNKKKKKVNTLKQVIIIWHNDDIIICIYLKGRNVYENRTHPKCKKAVLLIMQWIPIRRNTSHMRCHTIYYSKFAFSRTDFVLLTLILVLTDLSSNLKRGKYIIRATRSYKMLMFNRVMILHVNEIEKTHNSLEN